MYLKFPTLLDTSSRYQSLSSDAKLLYIHLNSRRELSIKNGWFDEEKKPYIYCNREEMAAILGASVSTACRALKQLTDAGLVRTGKRSVGCSPRLYVTDLLSSAYRSRKDSSPASYNMDDVNAALLEQFMGLD